MALTAKNSRLKGNVLWDQVLIGQNAHCLAITDDDIHDQFVMAVVLDGAAECRKARRLIAGDVDHKQIILIWCNAHLFNILFVFFTEPNQKVHVMKYALFFVMELNCSITIEYS